MTRRLTPVGLLRTTAPLAALRPVVFRLATVVLAVLSNTPAFAQQHPLAAHIAVKDVSGHIESGEATTVLVEVRNTGAEVWRAQGDVRLSYHWLRPSGDLVTYDGERTLLTSDVLPGQSASVCATMLAPDQPGIYVVEWAMVREGVAWFADSDASERQRPVVVTAAATTRSERPPSALLLFYGVTIGHFPLTFLWLKRSGCLSFPSKDQALFTIVCIGLGSFVAVLHIVACTVGLSLSAVLIAVVICHGFAAMFSGSRPLKAAPSAGPPAAIGSSALGERFFELIGTIVLAAVIVQWFWTAIGSMAVVGTDAEHYHVPNAVNFALGANPWNFVATPHLYPMGTSILAAWFILPLDDPLLIDLTLAPVFLLTFAALVSLFRQVTGASGLAWVPWFMLPLFATPMLQTSSFVSADLMYAASFLALNTSLFTIWSRGTVDVVDLVITAFALGLLLGSKTTGTVSAALLLATYGVVLGPSWRQLSTRVPRLRRAVAWFAVCALIASAAGGTWPLRNWINYGSPLAPSGLSVFGKTVFRGDSVEEGRYYLSVLRDLRDVPGYRPVERTVFFSRQWFGEWYLPLTLAFMPMLGEAVVWRQRRKATERIRLLAVVAILTLPHVALLVQAPWSSLEWTKGLALRYVLPFCILWPFLAYLVLFPVGWRWTLRFWPSLTLGTTIAAVSTVFFVRHATFPALPPLTPGSVAFTGLMLAIVSATYVAARSSKLTAGLLPLALSLVLVWICAAQTASADSKLRKNAPWARGTVPACTGRTPAPYADRYTAVYARVLDYEEQNHQVCQSRRFFVTARFDSPMALQPPPFVNLVYDTRPRTMVERAIAAEGPGTEACDYLIASDAELHTDRGTPLVNQLRGKGWLVELGPSPPYVLFAVRRR